MLFIITKTKMYCDILTTNLTLNPVWFKFGLRMWKIDVKTHEPTMVIVRFRYGVRLLGMWSCRIRH